MDKEVELDPEIFNRLQTAYKEEKRKNPKLETIDEFAEKMLRFSLENYKEDARCLS